MVCGIPKLKFRYKFYITKQNQSSLTFLRMWRCHQLETDTFRSMLSKQICTFKCKILGISKVCNAQFAFLPSSHYTLLKLKIHIKHNSSIFTLSGLFIYMCTCTLLYANILQLLLRTTLQSQLQQSAYFLGVVWHFFSTCS